MMSFESAGIPIAKSETGQAVRESGQLPARQQAPPASAVSMDGQHLILRATPLCEASRYGSGKEMEPNGCG